MNISEVGINSTAHSFFFNGLIAICEYDTSNFCILMHLTGWASGQGWMPHGDHEYWFSQIEGIVEMMWFDARAYCMEVGADLASIHNDNEKNFIYETVSSLF